MMNYHEPVLLSESIAGLNITEGGTYVDVTYGGGGHSGKILELLKGGRLIAFDQDQDAINQKIKDDRMMLIQQNFNTMLNYLKFYKLLPVHGIIADLGVSSHQIDTPERGFSNRFEAALDMRMDRRQELSAATVINKYREEELQNIFSQYGEVHNAKTLAATIVKARANKTIETVNDLLTAISHLYQPHTKSKYLAKVFQALRIEVNNEIEVLKKFLTQCEEALMVKGRLVVISYHSLEDRLVKRFMKTGNFEGEQRKDFYGNPVGVSFTMISKGAITPSLSELKRNPRARSARMRIAEKR